MAQSRPEQLEQLLMALLPLDGSKQPNGDLL
jgi:hypothetical protein